MNTTSILLQQPASPQRLVLLTHGVGATPQAMAGVGQWFAQRDPRAMVVSLASAYPSDVSNGLQWFSVRGVTEENRQERVDAAMPIFLDTIAAWQKEAGLDAAHTMIVGFSQGAIMALESTRLWDAPASTIVSIAGRYAALPTAKPAATIHLLHGTADHVMPVELAHASYARLQSLEAQVTLDIVEDAGHAPHPRMLELLAAHLPTT